MSLTLILQRMIEASGGGGGSGGPIVAACVATSNITLSGEQTIDGIATSTSIVFVAGQTTQANRGVWVSAAGAWSRHADFATFAAHVGKLVVVVGGTVYHDTIWMFTVDSGGTLNTTAITSQLMLVPPASASVAGVMKLATSAQVLAQTNDDSAITPAKLASILRVKTAVLEDNTAVLLTTLPINNIGVGFLVTGTTVRSAAFVWRTLLGSESLTPLVEGAGATDLDFLVGIVSGTTGADTNTTLALQATTGVMTLENRAGGSQGYQFVVFTLG